MGLHSVTGALVPRKDSPGTDIFRNDNGDCIVRSDLGCYLQTKGFLEKGQDIKILRLHPACLGGEHYVGCEGDPHIYILKGNSYGVVKNLSMDEESDVFELHPKCQGGDHYGRNSHGFFIIFQEQGKIRWVTDLRTAAGEQNEDLHPECCQGLYYFGILDLLTLIKVDEKWGAQFYLYKEVSSVARLISFYSIHPDILNFFPGGLTLTKGISTGGWVCIKNLNNDSKSSIAWSDKVSRKVGYAKQQRSIMEHNWSVLVEVSLGGTLTKLITQIQFSFKAKYGGKSVHTEQEDWSDVREEEESLQVTLGPKEHLYIWQYHLGISQEPILFCKDIQFTKDNHPPTLIPLPVVP